MINIILFGSFFVMLFLNIPICVSLGLSAIFAMLYSGDKLSIVPTNVYGGMAKFLLLAIPFFVLSGNIIPGHGGVCVISGDCILFVCVHLEHHHHHCQSFLSKGEETGD